MRPWQGKSFVPFSVDSVNAGDIKRLKRDINKPLNSPEFGQNGRLKMLLSIEQMNQKIQQTGDPKLKNLAKTIMDCLYREIAYCRDVEAGDPEMQDQCKKDIEYSINIAKEGLRTIIFNHCGG